MNCNEIFFNIAIEKRISQLCFYSDVILKQINVLLFVVGPSSNFTYIRFKSQV